MTPRERRSLIGAVLIGILIPLGLGGVGRAVDSTVEGHIVFITDASIYLDVAPGHQLQIDDVGTMRKKGVPVAQVKVLRVGEDFAYVQIIAKTPKLKLRTGDSFVFESRIRLPTQKTVPSTKARELDKAVMGGNLEPEVPGAGRGFVPVAEVAAPPAATGKTTSSEPPTDFVPLLAAAPPRAKKVISRAGNIFHGRIGLRGTYQQVDPNISKNWVGRVDSDGSIDRLWAGPWSVSWSGNVTYRNGNTFSSATDFRKPRLHVYRAMASRIMENEGFLRLGRLIPLSLPGLGYVDGGHLEQKHSDHWRWGTVLGVRPDPRDLNVAGRNPLASAYATLEAGERGRLYYSGTAGLLQTLFKGKADEFAVLYDQRSDLGPKLNLFATSQLNFNVGGAEIYKEPRLTRLDFYGVSPLASFLSLRSGMSHYERPDTAAERDLSGASNTASFTDTGYWRYWFGASQPLPLDLQTDEEIAYLRTGESYSKALWRFTLSRRGLWLMPQAQLSGTVYNLNQSVEGEGVGLLSSLYVPLLQGRLSLNGTAGFRYGAKVGESKKIRTNDLSAHLNWRLTSHWEVNVGIARAFQDYIASTVADAGINYRW